MEKENGYKNRKMQSIKIEFLKISVRGIFVQR